MLNAGGGRSQKDIGQKTMAVSTHCDQVAATLFHPLDDLIGRFAIGQFRLGRDSRGLKFALDLVQVIRVFSNFRAYSVAAVGSSRPPIGDVEQHQPAVGESGKLLDEAFVSRADKFLNELIWMAKTLRYGRDNIALDS